MDPLTILATLAPLLVDGGKALIGKYLAPDEFKPSNVDDYLKMRQTDLEMFKAMQDQASANSYPWVDAVVRLMRPCAALLVLGTWASLHYYGGANAAAADNFAGAIGFYLFGDRTLFYARKAQQK
jgi:hypothetical protein